MNIVGISGSMNPDSTTKKAVAIALQAAERAGAKTELIHLADWPLPVYDVRDDESTYPETVHRFIQKISDADALLIASPEYHGTLTGALKNAIDFLAARHLREKPVAVMGIAASSLGAANTVNTLHLIMRNLHAWAIPNSPSIPNSSRAFGPDGKLIDARLHERVELLGQQLVRMVRMIKAEKQLN